VKYLTKKEISAAYASNESRSSELLEDNKKNKIKKKCREVLQTDVYSRNV